MAKIDRFRSPEEAERLADLKRGVNLVALATERYGLTITEKNRDNSAYTLENDARDVRITVKTAPEGYHIYHNHKDDRDNGSVVDFLQHRHPGTNLGQIKGMLQDMVPGAKQALDYEKFEARQVQKLPSAADARYEALPASERRAAMVRETMGPNPQLTDASYLLERGLTKETVNDPAFKGRVFTDQHPERQERLGVPQRNVGFPFYNEKGVQSWELRNRAPEGETDSFKMMMKAPGDEYGAKNGVWSSNLLQGKGSQPERMIIGESPIDMMSKFQTEKQAATAAGQDLPNSRYVATGGTPSIEQKAIIQAIIDREQPKQVILSNDNDAAGQAFNVRYLNDLRPPVAGLTPEQQQEAAAARERITWIAGDNGKKGDEKLLTMTISLKTDTAKEGRELVENLRSQAEMRSLPAEEPGTPGTAGLQVRRNAPEVTEVVLRVAPAQADAVVDLARELRREREQAMPEAARTPENYFVVEKANGKDYNQDILQGRADAQLESARREAGFTVAPAVAEVTAAPQVAEKAAGEKAVSGPNQVDAEFERFVNRPDVAAAIAASRQEERETPASSIAQLSQRLPEREAEPREPSLSELRELVEQERQKLGEQRVATPQIAADIDLNGSTSAEEILRADRNRDGVVSGSELDAARFDARQAREPQQQSEQPIAADINLNGSTSAAEILRADANRDGVVTGTELNTARFEQQQAQERSTTEQTEAERQAEVRRKYEQQRAEQLAADQQQEAQQRDTSGPLRSAAIVVFEAEGLPAGTLAAGSTTLVTMAEKMKEAIEAQGSAVSVREGRDATTGQPYSMLGFNYHEGSAEHGKIQEVLRDAQREGGVGKYFGIQPGEEMQREAAPITRTVALNEQPLAIALDTPNPLLESQLRATGATVSNEPVQERPGLVVVVDTQKAEQLASVEQTLSKLPASAQVVEAPEASEMRQQLTQTFREQGGVAPALQAEAILPERIPNDAPERLREAGATVAPALNVGRPELPEGALAVRYPLDQPEVIARVSVVLDEVNTRSSQLALDLGKAPDVATGSVVETPLAQQTRQLVAKEQGLEPAAPRELPERQPTEDRPLDRPKNEVIGVVAQQPAAAQPEAKPEAGSQPVRPISAEPEPHPIERRVILDISADKAGMVPLFQAGLSKGGFEVRTAPIQAVGEEKEGTRIEALYRTTDSVAAREKQQAVLQKMDTPAMQRAEGMKMYEPAGQAQERAEDLKPVMPLKGKDGKVDASRMIAAGQQLQAQIVVLEAGGEKERTGKLWEDLRAQGGKVNNIAAIPAGAEGTKFQFQVSYGPTDARLPKLSATLEAAASSDGVQVTETDNMRRERLARASLVERKELAKLSPEQQQAYERPALKEYPAGQPGAYERVALTSEALKTPEGVKSLREELKETGATVAVQQLDGRPANSGTVVLSYLAEGPKAGAVNEVLQNFAEKGGHVYDLKAGQDRGTEQAPVVAVEAQAKPLTAEQEREANLAELRSLEARREALLESQREGLAKSQQAEQALVPAVAAAIAAEPAEPKVWVAFGVDLRGEDLRNMDATAMDLRGANLAGQDLRSTDLRNSDLREANLTGADMRGMNLTGVRLEDAVMDGANLEKAFRVVEGADGKRQIEDNLTPAVLTGPEREGTSYVPTVALNEQRLATPEMTAAGEDNSPAAAPRVAQMIAPQYSGLSLPTEAELNQQQVQEPRPTLERPMLSVPTQQELALVTSAAEPVVELPAVAGRQEAGKGQVTAEAVGLEVPAPVAAPGSLSRYEELEQAGTARHPVTITITQAVAAEAGADAPDRVKEVQERLIAAGAEPKVGAPVLDADGKTETSVLQLSYRHDDRELPALNKALNEVAALPGGPEFSVRVEDENAAARAVTAESRMQNTPEAAKALAAELHDGSDTARVLVQRPSLEDAWALENAGAKVERIYLPDGPAAMVSYPAAEPGVTSAVSIELDRIERDSALTRPPHNSNDRQVSGSLLGEDPTQQERRQEMAKSEGLVLEPNPRYENNEMAERDARAKSYFQEEIARPSGELSGQLANGEPFKGGLTDVLRLEQPDREALEAGWKAEKTLLLLVVQQTPDLRLEENGPAVWPGRVAEALREAGAETQVKDLGVSADTGLEKHVVAVSFDNSDPALARIQATLNRLADQDGVQVPAEGYWQREAVLGPNGSRMAEPVVAERDRPWLEAVVGITEPTAQERRELTRAGARIEDAQIEGQEGKSAILVYYNLDKPAEVAKVSAVLDRAEESGRSVGETWEAGQARGGRVEQYQQDIRQEKQQDNAAWEQLSQKYPGTGAKVENEVAEPALAMSFADRIRSAVSEQIAELKATWEATTPEKVAIYAAEQRGIADRKALEQQQAQEERQRAAEAAAAPQREAEKAAYERGFRGPEAPAPSEAEKAAAGGVAPGTHGTSAEVATDKILRERRDDELTKPIVMDAPKEGKILETTEQVVKPSTVGTPDQQQAPGEKAVTPPVVETPAVAAAVVTSQEAEKPREKELQYGFIGMGDSSKLNAEDRMERVRTALQNAGATVEAVVPPTRDNKDATLAYSYDPLDKHLPQINEVLANVHRAKPSMIKEEPHSMHYAGITPNAHEISKRDWPEREGQFNKAHIVVDDFDQRGTSRAEAVKKAFTQEGAVVGEVKKDGHGHVELDVTYHTHSPNIEKINRTLDQAGNTPGIEVRELDTDRSARYQGAIDREVSSMQDKGRERGE